jgi:hypothetical protein
MTFETPYRRRYRTRLRSIIMSLTLTAMVLAATGDVGLNGLLPVVSATPVHLPDSRFMFANTHGVKRLHIESKDSLPPIPNPEGAEIEVNRAMPSLIYRERPDRNPVSDRFDEPIYATAALHARSWNLDTRAANQSTKNMGGDYVKLKQEYNGGYIVLSVIIAFVGSLCTLELLLRR